MLRRALPLAVSLLLLACGGGAALAPAQAPPSPSSPPSPQDGTPSATDKPASAGLDQAPAGVQPPAEDCRTYAPAAPPSCGSGDFTEQLALALSESGATRDAKLYCLEKSSEPPAGLVRALRAELAPRGCGDVVVENALGASATPRELEGTLLALGLGARLYRSVRNPPLPRAPFNKAEFLKHFKEVLSPWIVAQAQAVDALSQPGPRLSGYARGVVALEAGLADMRFVDVARAIELPAEMKSDPEIRETYLVALEQALEPRVARGRDAALVGLGELSRQGITRDARLAEARTRLSELYAGRRLDALDKLLLPPLAPPSQDSAALRVAASLPAFYATKLSHTLDVTDLKLLRARLEQGVPPALLLTTQAKGSPELIALTQRALFQLGQLYFWAEPFGRAALLPTASQDENAALIAALAKVLARGPRNAAAMMLGPPILPAELRDTAPLDALAKAKGPLAGVAELDAAYLRGLAPPENDAAFWKEQAARYSRAQQKLTDTSAKAMASELAKAALATEKALRK